MNWSRRHPRTVLPAFVLALLLALVAVGWQGYRQYTAVNPRPGPVLARGEPVAAPGFDVQITDVRRAYALPAEEKGDPAVHGPKGSELVLVFFTSTLSGAAADDALCDFTLVGPDGTRWFGEPDVAYALRRPKSVTCRGGDDDGVAPGRPLQGAVTFLVPASARDLVLEVGLSSFGVVARRQL